MAEERFHIKSDSPAAADLMFWSVVGHEALSRPSLYELTVLSKNKGVDAKDVLGHAFDVTIDFQDADGGAHERHCQGHAVRFVRLRAIGRFFEYRITLRSWFGLLAKRTNSRILQDKSVLEVLDAVFEDSPIKRFKKLGSGGVIGTHKSRRYCVQHQESDYRFLSRLLEDAGIYYWFDAHDAPGTMHLADASDVAHEKLPVADTLNFVPQGAGEGRYNEIRRWVSARRFDTGKHAARDSDFKAIRKKVGADIDAHDDHELADLEIFEFPGGYFSGEDADTTARVRGDELQARRDRHWALTRWPDVAVGRAFTFSGDPEGVTDGDYTIAACTFVATHAGYEGIHVQEEAESIGAVLHNALADDAVNADTLDMLESLIADTPELRRGVAGNIAFLLTVLPADMPFRPPRLTPRVTMPGPQSGIVVGPKGDEHHVDDMGRVKVHFHWDRYDESNEKSTCWVRVSQPWAGDGWGGYFAPRIGQEVIVDFLNGDPDRPIIVGRMYNDDQPIPYKSATQSGFRTRSTPGGGVNNYNEIMFEDKKGAEAISIHAELDMSTSVENDQSTKVDRHQTNTIKKNRTTNILEGNDTLTIGKGNRTTTISTGTETVTIKGLRTVKIDGGEDVKIKPSRKTVVAVDDATYSTTMTHYATGAYSLRGASMTLDCIGAYGLKVGGGFVSTAASYKFGTMGNMDFSCIQFNRTVVEANDVVTGANTETYIGASSSTVIGSAMNIFQGAQQSMTTGPDNAVYAGIQISSALGVSISNVLGVDISNGVLAMGMNAVDMTMAGVGLDQNAIKLYNAGGAGGPGAASMFSTGAAAAAAMGVAVGLGAGLGSSAAVYMNLTEQRDKDLEDLKGKVSPATWTRLQALRNRTGVFLSNAARVAEVSASSAADGAATVAQNVPAMPTVPGPSADDAAFMDPPAH